MIIIKTRTGILVRIIKRARKGSLGATAILELLSIAKTGQQQVGGSSDLKGVKSPSFPLWAIEVCMCSVGPFINMKTLAHT